MTSKTKGEFLINYCKYHKNYPKWDNSFEVEKNVNRRMNFIASFIHNLTDKDFEKIMEMWELKNDDIKDASEVTNKKVDVCFCGHKRHKHSVSADTHCLFCECDKFKFNKAMDLEDYKKTMKTITATINLREFCGTNDDVHCFLCWETFKNEDEALVHLGQQHKNEDFINV